MQPRRTFVFACVTLLALSACGSAAETTTNSTAEEAVRTTNAPAGEDFSDGTTTQDTTAQEITTQETVFGDASADTTPPVDDTQPTESAEPTEPAATTPATEAVAEAADDPVLGGRLLPADVEPSSVFDGNPFPSLLVDDIGKGTQVNIANILPSDRPVLLWAWAPH